MTPLTGLEAELKPNFFVVGAAKCGTTSLFRYLEQHPGIFMSRPKEPHHFGSDLSWRQTIGVVRDRERYLGLFEEGKGHPRAGEASVWYLYSKKSAEDIRAFNPNARIVCMVRNPVDQMFSLFRFSFSIGAEDIPDFSRALDAEEDRKAGRRIPKGSWFVPALFYREVPRFTEQIHRYYEQFGREQVLVLVFDDFVRDTPGEYRKTLEFLGVDPEFSPEFEVHNKTRPPQNMTMRRFWKRHPHASRFVHRRLSRRPKWFVKRVIGKFLKEAPEPRLEFDPELRRALIEEYRPEVESLSELLGRDLSHWSAEA